MFCWVLFVISKYSLCLYTHASIECLKITLIKLISNKSTFIHDIEFQFSCDGSCLWIFRIRTIDLSENFNSHAAFRSHNIDGLADYAHSEWRWLKIDVDEYHNWTVDGMALFATDFSHFHISNRSVSQSNVNVDGRTFIVSTTSINIYLCRCHKLSFTATATK